MYLSTFAINSARRGAQKLLASPHAMHAAVLAGFPDSSSDDNGRVLWRLDNDGKTPKLVIVSPSPPDLTHLAEQAGWPRLEDAWKSSDYLPLLRRLEKGQRYRFRITANPTRSVRDEPGSRGKPQGHVTVAQQEKWFLDRAERCGFEVLTGTEGASTLVVRDRTTLSFRRREVQVTLRVATFEGALSVTDAEEFRRTLGHGIGRAKGYGCGLLTIAPVS